MVRVCIAALALAVATGCADEPGELDAETVNRIARTQGNAVGFGLSGEWTATVDVVDCSQCPPLFIAPELSMCSSLTDFFPDSGGTISTSATVIQSDGTLLLRSLDLGGTGPLDADGNFVVGRVTDLTTVVSEGTVIVRVDGAIDMSADRPTMSATLRQRVAGQIVDEEIDCVQSFELTAVR